MNFFNFAVETFDVKRSAWVLSEFKKNGIAIPAFTSQLGPDSTSFHLPGIHLVTKSAMRASHGSCIIGTHLNFLATNVSFRRIFIHLLNPYHNREQIRNYVF